MNYIPIEFIIIGAAVVAGKKKVTSKEVSEFQVKCPYPLEFGSELKFCTYDENKDTYTLNENLQIHPYILKILTSFI